MPRPTLFVFETAKLIERCATVEAMEGVATPWLVDASPSSEQPPSDLAKGIASYSEQLAKELDTITPSGTLKGRFCQALEKHGNFGQRLAKLIRAPVSTDQPTYQRWVRDNYCLSSSTLSTQEWAKLHEEITFLDKYGVVEMPLHPALRGYQRSRAVFTDIAESILIHGLVSPAHRQRRNLTQSALSVDRVMGAEQLSCNFIYGPSAMRHRDELITGLVGGGGSATGLIDILNEERNDSVFERNHLGQLSIDPSVSDAILSRIIEQRQTCSFYVLTSTASLRGHIQGMCPLVAAEDRLRSIPRCQKRVLEIRNAYSIESAAFDIILVPEQMTPFFSMALSKAQDSVKTYHAHCEQALALRDQAVRQLRDAARSKPFPHTTVEIADLSWQGGKPSWQRKQLSAETARDATRLASNIDKQIFPILTPPRSDLKIFPVKSHTIQMPFGIPKDKGYGSVRVLCVKVPDYASALAECMPELLENRHEEWAFHKHYGVRDFPDRQHLLGHVVRARSPIPDAES